MINPNEKPLNTPHNPQEGHAFQDVRKKLKLLKEIMKLDWYLELGEDNRYYVSTSHSIMNTNLKATQAMCEKLEQTISSQTGLTAHVSSHMTDLHNQLVSASILIKEKELKWDELTEIPLSESLLAACTSNSDLGLRK